MQQPLIETTLFRVEQLKPFFKKINSYPDDRMLLSFPRDYWMELRKPDFAPSDGYPGGGSCVVSGVKSEDIGNPRAYMYNLARLFDSRNVRVEAYDNLKMELDPIDPLSINDLMFKLIGFSDNKKRPTRDTKMENIAHISRVEQLLGLTDWINSYSDPILELCVSSSAKACIKLQKPESCEDKYAETCRYDVIGKSHSHIFERIAVLFSKTPVKVEVRNVLNNPSYEPLPPIQLENFIVNCARYCDNSF